MDRPLVCLGEVAAYKATRKVMIVNNIINLTTNHGEILTLEYEGENLVQVTALGGRVYTRSYLPCGSLYVADPMVPSYGIISPYTRKEVEEIALAGGRINLYVEDVVDYVIAPTWWSVECAIASDGDAPAWPLAEDDLGGEEAWSLFGLIWSVILRVEDDDEDEE